LGKKIKKRQKNMYSLYLINETFTSGYRGEVLDIISIIAVLCSILVITSKNPIVSVLFLIGLFLSIASYLMVLGLNFIGLAYLLVYVGAVSILFLFILMLINVRISEIMSNTSNSIALAIFITIFFYYPVYSTASFNSIVYISNKVNNLYNLPYDSVNKLSSTFSNDIFYVTSKI
jgi:NADH-ubiquinone oxidoreductase chain 6